MSVAAEPDARTAERLLDPTRERLLDPTRERLLDAAESLIAERGVRAVSIRAINTAADANVAAVHYHFGTREQLVTAVLHRRMDALAAERASLLAPLEALDHPPIRTVAEALVRPLSRLAATPEGLRYVRFLAALEHAGSPWWDLVAASFEPQWRRFEPVLARSLPHLSPELRAFRFAVMSSTLFGPALTAHSALPRAQRGDALVDLVSAALSAP